jgi:hypothetical protein
VSIAGVTKYVKKFFCRYLSILANKAQHFEKQTLFNVEKNFSHLNSKS